MAIRISAVVPTWCEERRISSLVSTLTREVDEVIVVDAESPDRTRELAAAAGARVLTAPKGRGFQLNAGAKASEADVLVFVHADTGVPEGFGEAIRNTVKAGAEAGNFRLEFQPRSQSARFFTWSNHVRRRYMGIYYGDSCMFVKRSVFKEIGGFPDQPIFEDYVLARRLGKAARTKYITAPVVTSSARRFSQEPMRTVLVWTALQCAFSLGVPASRLARFYADTREQVHA